MALDGKRGGFLKKINQEAVREGVRAFYNFENEKNTPLSLIINCTTHIYSKQCNTGISCDF